MGGIFHVNSNLKSEEHDQTPRLVASDLVLLKKKVGLYGLMEHSAILLTYINRKLVLKTNCKPFLRVAVLHRFYCINFLVRSYARFDNTDMINGYSLPVLFALFPSIRWPYCLLYQLGEWQWIETASVFANLISTVTLLHFKRFTLKPNVLQQVPIIIAFANYIELEKKC